MNSAKIFFYLFIYFYPPISHKIRLAVKRIVALWPAIHGWKVTPMHRINNWNEKRKIFICQLEDDVHHEYTCFSCLLLSVRLVVALFSFEKPYRLHLAWFTFFPPISVYLFVCRRRQLNCIVCTQHTAQTIFIEMFRIVRGLVLELLLTSPLLVGVPRNHRMCG